MDVTLLKQPYEISFAGNPLQFIFQVAPYGDKEKSLDITLIVRVLIENSFNSNSFEQVYLQKFYPADDGTVSLDISGIVSPYLEYYTPRTDLSVPVEATAQRKRYKVSYILQTRSSEATVDYDGGPIPIGDISNGGYTDSAVFSAIKGGLAYEAWHYKEFFTTVIQQNKKPLLFQAAGELVAPEALKYFFWLYPFDDFAAQTILYKVYLSDGTNVSLTNPVSITAGKWSVCCVPCGFNQCGLNGIIPAGKSPVKYSVTITTTSNTIVDEYFFNLDGRNFYDPYYLLYRNSIGGLETIRLTGEVDRAGDYAQQQAQRTVPPAWYNPNLAGQITDEYTEEAFNYTADTGWMSTEGEMKLRDLLVSKQKMSISISPDGNARLLPIAMNGKTVKFSANKDQMISASIQWQLAFINNYFTPGALMPQTRTCPAVEKFFAVQLNKSLLQFLWSLEDPYSLIEVQVIIGAETNIYTYKGNTGMISQTFDNPATSDPVDITIKARTICNQDTVPVDYGPFTTITLSVTGNSLPVAIDDYFQIPSGFSSPYPLPVSALANDFDPDGDPIEAVVNWGVTQQTGVWTINAQGFITYQPQYSTFTGEDYFDYQIRQVGGTDVVTARVHLTVGNGPQQVYVKWVMRNQKNQADANGGSGIWAEAWLDFFSDAACITPVDLTGLNITIKATEDTARTGQNPSTHHEDYSFIPQGTKRLMWSGIISYRQVGVYTITTQFTVLEGTGYVAVN